MKNYFLNNFRGDPKDDSDDNHIHRSNETARIRIPIELNLKENKSINALKSMLKEKKQKYSRELLKKQNFRREPYSPRMLNYKGIMTTDSNNKLKNINGLPLKSNGDSI